MISKVKNWLRFIVRKTIPFSIRKELWKILEQWSIGIYISDSPLDFSNAIKSNNPVLTRKDISELKASFVADPFMVKVDSIWYLFFEVLNQKTNKGEIGLATSEDGRQWNYQKIVLKENFHLSYPYVFEWNNQFYMIPETHEANAVRLYQASKFPTKWFFVETLLTGFFVDSSIFRHQERWWLFTETNAENKYDTLRLYYAEKLTGPWLEHPQSPIVTNNNRIARPAGRVIFVDDKIIRYAQDCYPNYGTQVWALEITKLTTTSYQEREIRQEAILTPSGKGWNRSGMHHIDAHLLENGQWIACVDGWYSYIV